MTRKGWMLTGGLALATVAAIVAPARVRDATEQPEYEVLDRVNGLVIRRYGPRLAAETDVEGGDIGRAFRRLAGFIYGGNRAHTRVAMTAPVEVGTPERIAMTTPVEVGPALPGDARTMRFFMPRRFTSETLPEPTDARVRVVEVPAETLAVLRFSGSGRDEKAARRRAQLLDGLANTRWAPAGEPAFFFYDAPWVPTPLRRNEVVVRVTRRS